MKSRSYVYVAKHLDDPLHLVQIADGCLDDGEMVESAVARGLIGLLKRDLIPYFA